MALGVGQRDQFGALGFQRIGDLLQSGRPLHQRESCALPRRLRCRARFLHRVVAFLLSAERWYPNKP